ncbi:MAG: hypothetical protein AAFZ18_27945 [Myxococcota bacterium]
MVYERAQSVFREGWQGVTGDHAAVATALKGREDPTARAWGLVLDAQGFLAGAKAPPMDPDEVAILSQGASEAPVSIACQLGVHQALLAFDLPKMARWISVVRGCDSGALLPTARRTVAEAWLAFAEQRGFPLGELEVAEGAAREGGDAPLTVESVVLQSVFGSDGLRRVRRASRMAQTESLPQPQYLANLFLARQRRLDQRPHLAIHILQALLRVAPAPWLGWMTWERALAGGALARSGPAAHVWALVEAAEAGDRAGISAYIDAPGPLAFPPVDQDLADAARLILGRGGPRSGLTALAGHHSERTLAETPIWAVAHGDDRRHVLSLGLGFFSSVDVRPSGRRQRARTDTAICALLLEGAAPEPAFFERLYGFPYEAELHRGTRDMLYHRMRERLSTSATLVREDGELRIELHRGLAVPDPRWAPAPENAVLTALARLGAATAQEAAAALGLPLRTAQHVLRTLAKDGVCRIHREGRKMRYAVEDTTFAEPTQRSGQNAQVAKDA